MCRRAISVIRCRSTPSPSGFLHFQKFGLDAEQQAEPNIVADLLDEIENETLYLALITVDKRTLQIVLLKMQGYSTKEIAPLVHLTAGAIYARLNHLRKKLRKIL